MNGHEAPIEVLDPSFGRLTVMRFLVGQLPSEDLIYLSDTVRASYGPQPIAQIREFTIQGLDHLAGRGVKALVIACSSVSSAVLRDTQEHYDVPILEMILPATRRTFAASDNNRVGVVCTEAMTTFRLYDDTFTVAGNVRLTTQVCPRFVKSMEAGITGGEELLGVVHEYLTPLQTANVDTPILDYTHYLLFTGVINYVLGDGMVLVSSSGACAQDTYVRLIREGPLRDVPRRASRQLLITGDADPFQGIGERLFERFVHDVEQAEFR